VKICTAELMRDDLVSGTLNEEMMDELTLYLEHEMNE